MSAEVLVVKNDPEQGIGVLQDVLEANSVSYEIAGHDTEYPAPTNYGAMFVFGSYDSVNDNSPRVSRGLHNINMALEQEVPYFGTCFGMQALAKLSGSSVTWSREFKEIGFEDDDKHSYEVELTPEGREDPLFSGLPEKLKSFRLHHEGVSLGPDISLLGTGRDCPVQTIKAGDKSYGSQSHFELTRHMLMAWTLEDAELQILGHSALLAQFDAIEREYTANGRRLYENFLGVAGLVEQYQRF